MAIKVGIVMDKTPNSTGNVTYTDTTLGGLTPTCYRIYHYSRKNNRISTSNSHACSGACDGTNQWSIWAGGIAGEGSTVCGKWSMSDKCVFSVWPEVPGINCEAQHYSLSANSVTLNWTNASGSGDEIYFVIVMFAGTTGAKAGVFTPATTQNDHIHVDVDFHPHLLYSDCCELDFTDAYSANMIYSAGIAVRNYYNNDITQRGLYWKQLNGQGAGQPKQRILTDGIFKSDSAGWRLDVTQMNYDSGSDQGFTVYTRDAASPASSKNCGYLAIAGDACYIGDLTTYGSVISTSDPDVDVDYRSLSAVTPIFIQLHQTVVPATDTWYSGSSSAESMGVGFANSTTRQYSMCSAIENGADTTSECCTGSNADICYTLRGNYDIVVDAKINTIYTDGFQLRYNQNLLTERKYVYLLIGNVDGRRRSIVHN